MEVESYGNTYNGSNGNKDGNSNDDFLFSRHWFLDGIIDEFIVTDNSLSILSFSG